MANLMHLSRVLVVEDQALIAIDIESTLRDAGVGDVVATGSADEAARLIASEPLDAAVLDLHLGANTWTYDLARSLQANGIPFVFSSGTVDVAEGFSEIPFVMKPSSAGQLIAALLQVTSTQSAIAAQ